MIKKIELTGFESINYIREQFEMGSKVLTNLLKEVPLQNGIVFSYVPEYVTNKAVYNFYQGGLYPAISSNSSSTPNLVPVRNDSKDFIANEIEEYLNLNDNNCCLFEESTARTSDNLLYKNNFDYVFLGEDMYYFIDRKSLNDESVRKAIRMSEGYYFICILSSIQLHEQEEFITGNEISNQSLVNLTKNLVSIFVSAYDGEGYLRWSS